MNSDDPTVPNCERINEGIELLGRVSLIAKELPDSQILKLLGNGVLDSFLTSIFDPRHASGFPTIAEFFLANKNRSALMASIRVAITNSCAIKGHSEEKVGFVSPIENQWFENAVMLLEGLAPFEGCLYKYENGKVSYAVASRDLQKGEDVGPDAFLFLDADDAKRLFDKAKSPTIHDLEVPVMELAKLLDVSEPDESKYQELLE